MRNRNKMALAWLHSPISSSYPSVPLPDQVRLGWVRFALVLQKEREPSRPVSL